MQIRIEIDVKPEELRRFLGLPDVAGLQEDIIHFLREKVGAASESFDPASFVKENLQTLKRSGAWQKLMASTKLARGGTAAEAPEEAAEAPKPKGRRRAPAKTASKAAAARAAAKRSAAAGNAPDAPSD